MIDLMSIITGVCPITDIVKKLGGPMFDKVTKQLEELPKKVTEIEDELKKLDEPEEEEKEETKEDRNEARKKKREEAKKRKEEKKKQQKEERKKKLEDQKTELKEQIEELKEQLNKMTEDIKKKVENSIEEAQKYADKVNQASSAIPQNVTSYNTALATLTVQASGAISAAIMNPGSASFTTPSIVAATQNVMKTKNDLKASELELVSSIAQIDKALSILSVVPGVGEAIITAVSTPLQTVADIVSGIMKAIP